jgi:nucleoside-diphosphate-sugar epimerase
MKEVTVLVTGASGLLGSHLAERLIQRGFAVRALVRPTAKVDFLQSLGVELVPGQLTNPQDCRAAVGGCSVVYHAAAKVGDWGKWSEFQVGCLDATRNLAEAASAEGVRRFVHISSTSAYGHPQEGGPPIDESAALGQNLWWVWDYYTRSKVECERMLWEMANRHAFPLTVIRPSWLFGERDRTTVDRLVKRLRGGGIPLIGHGSNPLSAIYAGEVAEAAILAAEDPGSLGEAYNVTDMGPITQKEYFQLWAEICGVKPTWRRHSYAAAYGAAFLLEAGAKLLQKKKPPMLTRYATWLMARNLSYSTEKARTKLGWKPALTYREAIERSVHWYDT